MFASPAGTSPCPGARAVSWSTLYWGLDERISERCVSHVRARGVEPVAQESAIRVVRSHPCVHGQLLALQLGRPHQGDATITRRICRDLPQAQPRGGQYLGRGGVGPGGWGG